MDSPSTHRVHCMCLWCASNVKGTLIKRDGSLTYSWTLTNYILFSVMIKYLLRLRLYERLSIGQLSIDFL